jgi:hypothetical protein
MLAKGCVELQLARRLYRRVYGSNGTLQRPEAEAAYDTMI